MAHRSRMRKSYDESCTAAQIVWQEELDNMIRRSDSYRTIQGKRMEFMKGKKNHLGVPVAQYTLEDYIRITTQYGEEAITDEEFINDYNKFVPMTKIN